MTSTDALTQTTYRDLKKIAGYYLSGERANHTLCPTALVHEAYLKHYASSANQTSSLVFRSVAARNMRQILVDYALSKKAQKRNAGATKIVFDDQVGQDAPDIDILALHAALNKLGEIEVTKENIVELRYFSGLSNEEVAEHLGLSLATVKRKWTAARAWLFRELS